jgi:hypothetical protein
MKLLKHELRAITLQARSLCPAPLRQRSKRLVPARQSVLAHAKSKTTFRPTQHQRGAAEGTLQHYSNMYQTPLKAGLHSLKSRPAGASSWPLTHAVLVQGLALQQGCTFLSYTKGILG